AGRALVKVNCASIPRDLFESESLVMRKGHSRVRSATASGVFRSRTSPFEERIIDPNTPAEELALRPGANSFAKLPGALGERSRDALVRQQGVRSVMRHGSEPRSQSVDCASTIFGIRPHGNGWRRAHSIPR